LKTELLQLIFGSAILEFASQNTYKNNIKTLGVPDTFIHQGRVEELHIIVKIDVDSNLQEIKKGA